MHEAVRLDDLGPDGIDLSLGVLIWAAVLVSVCKKERMCFAVYRVLKLMHDASKLTP